MRTVRPSIKPGVLAVGALLVATALPLHADEIRVMSSGGFAAAYLDLVGSFERASSHRVVTDATSTGVGADSIPSRIRRGDPVFPSVDYWFPEATEARELGQEKMIGSELLSAGVAAFGDDVGGAELEREALP